MSSYLTKRSRSDGDDPAKMPRVKSHDKGESLEPPAAPPADDASPNLFLGGSMGRRRRYKTSKKSKKRATHRSRSSKRKSRKVNKRRK